MKKYALVTDEDTAIAESTICVIHLNLCNMYIASMGVTDNKNLDFVDVSENDECHCIFCKH